MTELTKELVLGANDRPLEKVEVPQWGGHVYVRTMSARERDRFETSWTGDKSKDFDNLRARMAVATVCDKEGQLLFSPEDAEALGQKSAQALDVLAEVMQRLNGISNADVAELLDEQKKS